MWHCFFMTSCQHQVLQSFRSRSMSFQAYRHLKAPALLHCCSFQSLQKREQFHCDCCMATRQSCQSVSISPSCLVQRSCNATLPQLNSCLASRPEARGSLHMIRGRGSLFAYYYCSNDLHDPCTDHQYCSDDLRDPCTDHQYCSADLH
jgi:hypothetical protein